MTVSSYVNLHYLKNIWLACSNLYAIRSIIVFAKGQEVLTACLIGMSMVASFWYHLIEFRSNQLPGVIPSLRDERWQMKWLWLDRIAAGVAFLSAIKIEGLIDYWWLIMIALLVLLISEIKIESSVISRNIRPDYMLQDMLCTKYLIFHALWHLLAFHLAYLLGTMPEYSLGTELSHFVI